MIGSKMVGGYHAPAAKIRVGFDIVAPVDVKIMGIGYGRLLCTNEVCKAESCRGYETGHAGLRFSRFIVTAFFYLV